MPDITDIVWEKASRPESSGYQYQSADTKRSAKEKNAQDAVDAAIVKGQSLNSVLLDASDQKFVKNLTDYLRDNKDSWSVNIFELEKRSIIISSLFTDIKGYDFKKQIEQLTESKIKGFNNGIIFTDKLYKLLAERSSALEQKKAVIFAVTLLFFPTSLSTLIIEYCGLNIAKDVPIQPHFARLFGLNQKKETASQTGSTLTSVRL